MLQTRHSIQRESTPWLLVMHKLRPDATDAHVTGGIQQKISHDIHFKPSVKLTFEQHCFQCCDSYLNIEFLHIYVLFWKVFILRTEWPWVSWSVRKNCSEAILCSPSSLLNFIEASAAVAWCNWVRVKSSWCHGKRSPCVEVSKRKTCHPDAHAGKTRSTNWNSIFVEIWFLLFENDLFSRALTFYGFYLKSGPLRSSNPLTKLLSYKTFCLKTFFSHQNYWKHFRSQISNLPWKFSLDVLISVCSEI